MKKLQGYMALALITALLLEACGTASAGNMPTDAPKPTATATAEPTEAPEPTATIAPTTTSDIKPEGQAEITYDCGELEYRISYGTEYTVNSDGSMDVKFENQYQEIKLLFPEAIDMSQCEYVTIKAKSEYSDVSVKLYGEEFVENPFCNELFAYWNCLGKGVVDYELYPNQDAKVYGIGFMALNVAENYEEYKATIYAVTFHMKPRYVKPVPSATPKPTAIPVLTATATPTEVPKPTATLKPTATPKLTATPIPASAVDVTYNFTELAYTGGWEANHTEQSNGVLKLDYKKQWGEAQYALPQPIDMSQYYKFTVKAESGCGSFAVKLYDKDFNQVFVDYNCASEEVKVFEFSPGILDQVSYIAFMTMDDVEDFSNYQTTVYEVKFYAVEDESKFVAIRYDFNDLLYYFSGQTANRISDDGVMQVQYGNQYARVGFVLLEPLPMEKCKFFTIKAKSEYGSFYVELHDKKFTESMDNIWKESFFTRYDCKGEGVQEYKIYPNVDDVIYGIALAAQDEVADYSNYLVDFYEVTFYMEEGYEGIKAETGKVPQVKDPTLLDTYANVFEHVGTALTMNEILSEDVMAFVRTHYNTVVSGLETKPTVLLAGGDKGLTISTEKARKLGYEIPASYKEDTVPALNFAGMDVIMKRCAEEEMSYRIHTLIWHEKEVSWFYREDYSSDGAFVNPEEMDARFELYIRNVMNHICESEYSYVVTAIDVINEYPHINNDVTWGEVYGDPTQTPEFVKKAFGYVDDVLREYGMREQVSLVFNDYNTFDEVQELINIIQYINSDGKLCDGIGMQSHMHTHYPFDVATYRDALTAFAKEGLEIQVTELDICIHEGHTEEDLAKRYYEVMSALLEAKKEGANITHLVWWGYADDISWLKESTPLLFSTLWDKKPAYDSVIQAYKDAGYSVE